MLQGGIFMRACVATLLLSAGCVQIWVRCNCASGVLEQRVVERQDAQRGEGDAERRAEQRREVDDLQRSPSVRPQHRSQQIRPATEQTRPHGAGYRQGG